MAPQDAAGYLARGPLRDEVSTGVEGDDGRASGIGEVQRERIAADDDRGPLYERRELLDGEVGEDRDGALGSQADALQDVSLAWGTGDDEGQAAILKQGGDPANRAAG
jgi:hypothetical protein